MNALCAVLTAGLAFAAPSSGTGTLEGRVQETLDAGAYTYVRLRTAEGDRWAAVVKADLKPGSTVAVEQDMVMEDYKSRTLGRTFDRVVFGVIAGAPPAPGEPAGAPPAPTVEKAAGAEGRTVAEVFARRKDLSGRVVAVRGRVMKYNAGILGANWIHLRDGSGSAAGRDNDLVATTTDEASPGEVVTVRGTLRLDKDLGAGYFFPALIEKARVLK